MAELLKVENLRAGYGEAVVLQDVSLSLDEGQTLALLGRNGRAIAFNPESEGPGVIPCNR